MALEIETSIKSAANYQHDVIATQIADDTILENLNTAEFAQAICCKPDSLRSELCRRGNVKGIVPLKMGRRLLWPRHLVAELLSAAKDGGHNHG